MSNPSIIEARLKKSRLSKEQIVLARNRVDFVKEHIAKGEGDDFLAKIALGGVNILDFRIISWGARLGAQLDRYSRGYENFVRVRSKKPGARSQNFLSISYAASRPTASSRLSKAAETSRYSLSRLLTFLSGRFVSPLKGSCRPAVSGA